MKMEYNRPFVEIVDFAALERIATDARSEHEARDFEGGNNDSTNIGSVVTPAPTAGNEGVGDW